MKILLASLSYLPAVGGLVSYMANFGSFLESQGHRVMVVCSNLPGQDLPAEENLHGVSVHRVFALRSHVLDALFKPFVVVARLKKGLRASVLAADLVVVRHLYLAAALLLAGADRRKMIYLIPLAAPRLVWINRREGGFFRLMYNLWLIPQLFLLERWVVHRLSNIAVLSRSKRDELKQFYGLNKTPHVIPPGIDLVKYSPCSSATARSELLSKLGRPQDDGSKIILTVCRLVTEKNVAILLDALVEVADPSVKLYVVGNGPLLSDLQRMASELKIADQVVFFGHIENPAEYYRVAHLFLLPSTYEGFGHVFLEALASDVPVAGLASSPPRVITATEEIVSPEVGYVVKDNTPLGWAEMIIGHFGRKRAILPGACRQYAEEKFHWAAHLDKLISCLEGRDV